METRIATKTKDRLIVKEYQAPEEMMGKLYRANIEGEYSNLWEVLYADAECDYQPGDKVFVKKVFVSPIEYKGETYGSVRDVEILGYLKDVE
jgi:hypothetical protein